MWPNRRIAIGALLGLVAVAVLTAAASAAEFFLRAQVTTKTMPDSTVITMWGYALDSSFGGMEGGAASVPGPSLVVPPGDTTLIIHLDNNLSVPTSVIIPGQITPMIPVWDGGRVRSFTYETPPGNTAAVTYAWSNVRPGTYIYQSGTHPQVQIQMGLYGALKKDAAAGVAYPAVPYDNEVLLLFSEIDPALHEAVATGNYGPGKSMTSTINYNPQYFLINGQAHPAMPPPATPDSGPGETLLIRLLNAGLQTHSPVLLGMHTTVVAEDGFLYNHPREQYSVLLPAGKTRDVLVTPASAGMYPIFDRALHLTNGATSPGGMLAYIAIGP